MKNRPEPVSEEFPKRRIRIHLRDVARKIRKDQPPTTKVHGSKNAYKRPRGKWQDMIEEDEEWEDLRDFHGHDTNTDTDSDTDTDTDSDDTSHV